MNTNSITKKKMCLLNIYITIVYLYYCIYITKTIYNTIHPYIIYLYENSYSICYDSSFAFFIIYLANNSLLSLWALIHALLSPSDIRIISNTIIETNISITQVLKSYCNNIIILNINTIIYATSMSK